MIYSNVQFYYSSFKDITESQVTLCGEEYSHVVKVMRHKLGDIIYVTDGIGNIYRTRVLEISKSTVRLNILQKETKNELYSNITFYLPVLKSSERLEFAIEKCVELGITNFIIYSAEKSRKKGVKLDRWKKIVLAAMKQSLHSSLPNIDYVDSITFSNSSDCLNVVFDQLAEESFVNFLGNIDRTGRFNFIVGPEAGFTQVELDSISNKYLVYLTKDRLRTETALVSAASLISSMI